MADSTVIQKAKAAAKKASGGAGSGGKQQTQQQQQQVSQQQVSKHQQRIKQLETENQKLRSQAGVASSSGPDSEEPGADLGAADADELKVAREELAQYQATARSPIPELAEFAEKKAEELKAKIASLQSPQSLHAAASRRYRKAQSKLEGLQAEGKQLAQRKAAILEEEVCLAAKVEAQLAEVAALGKQMQETAAKFTGAGVPGDAPSAAAACFDFLQVDSKLLEGKAEVKALLETPAFKELMAILQQQREPSGPAAGAAEAETKPTQMEVEEEEESKKEEKKHKAEHLLEQVAAGDSALLAELFAAQEAAGGLEGQARMEAFQASLREAAAASKRRRVENRG